MRRGMAWPAVGVVGAVRPPRHHSRQEQAARPVLLWAAGARRPEVEEALRPLDGHCTVTGARTVHILTKVDEGLRPSQLSRPTSQPPTKVGPI